MENHSPMPLQRLSVTLLLEVGWVAPNLRFPADDSPQRHLQRERGQPAGGDLLRCRLWFNPSALFNMEELKNLQNPPAEVDALVNSVAQQESEEERQERERLAKLEACVVSLRANFPPDDDLLEINDERCFARKELIAIKAKAKQGKSTLEMILIAALLCGKWHYVRRLADVRPRILYIDTEMKPADTQLMNRKAMHLADLPETEDVPEATFINLRRQTADECQQALTDLLKKYHPDIVFIDGIVDLLLNFNDLEESQALIRKLLALAEEFNCCLVNVLHTNKATDDHNMRGHLGSFLTQKASLVFNCKKDAASNIVTVSCTESRHAPIADFTFAFDHEGYPTSAEELLQAMREEKAEKRKEKAMSKLDEKQDFIKQVLMEHGGIMDKADLIKIISQKFNICRATSYNLIKKLDPSQFSLSKDGKALFSLSKDLSNEQTELSFE